MHAAAKGSRLNICLVKFIGYGGGEGLISLQRTNAAPRDECEREGEHASW